MTASDSQDHEPEWASWSNEQLLNLPMSQLGVTLDGAFLSAQIQQLYAELDARQLLFRPHCWLSNEWFSPDGVPGIAEREKGTGYFFADLTSKRGHSPFSAAPDGCLR